MLQQHHLQVVVVGHGVQAPVSTPVPAMAVQQEGCSHSISSRTAAAPTPLSPTAVAAAAAAAAGMGRYLLGEIVP